MFTLLALLTVHFIADFVLQSNNMAVGKSKSLGWLTLHVAIYAACFLPFGWQFALLTLWLHWVTDYCTSRLTSKLWFVKQVFAGKRWRNIDEHTSREESAYYVEFSDSKRHWFFVAIGFDQLLHVWALALAAFYLL